MNIYRVIRKPILLIALFALVLAVPAMAQMTPEEAAQQFDIDLSGTDITTSSSLESALLTPQGYMLDMLRAWGANVEIVTLTTTSGVQALIANRTDLAPHGADELILGAAQGAGLVAFGSPQSKINYVLVGNTEIEAVEDLEGKTIGMSGPAGFDALLTRFSLQDVGLDPETDVNFVQIGGSPDRAAALLAGRVDAATIGLDDWFELTYQTDDVHLIQYMSEVVPDFPMEAYFSRQNYVEENPDVALAVACGNLVANRWANDNPDAFVQYTLENVPESNEQAVRDLYEAAMEVDMWPTDAETMLTTEGLQGLMEAMLETGDITSPVEVEQYIDLSFLQQAAEMGCGQ